MIESTKNKILLAKMPEGETIVSTTTFGGYFRYDFKYPFRHYVEPRYFIATKDSIYQLTVK